MNDEDNNFYENSMEEDQNDKPINDDRNNNNPNNTMFNRKGEINSRKKNNNGELLKELKEEDRKLEEINISKKLKKNDEDNEPDFYEMEEEYENDYQDSESDNENENKPINDNEEIYLKNKENELKAEKLDIKNIYEINKIFNYDKENPVFYIQIENKPLNTYLAPLSTKKLEEIIKKDKIPYESIKVKLVDLFSFKSKEPFIYVDLKEVLTPKWVSNVTHSKMFMELLNAELNSKNKSDKNEINTFNDISSIKKENNESISFSVDLYNKKENKKQNKKEDIKGDKKEDKKEVNNKINKTKKKGKKKGETLDIKTGFIYDN